MGGRRSRNIGIFLKWDTVGMTLASVESVESVPQPQSRGLQHLPESHPHQRLALQGRTAHSLAPGIPLTAVPECQHLGHRFAELTQGFDHGEGSMPLLSRYLAHFL